MQNSTPKQVTAHGQHKVLLQLNFPNNMFFVLICQIITH